MIILSSTSFVGKIDQKKKKKPPKGSRGGWTKGGEVVPVAGTERSCLAGLESILVHSYQVAPC
jgi:hypothetical protein